MSINSWKRFIFISKWFYYKSKHNKASLPLVIKMMFQNTIGTPLKPEDEFDGIIERIGAQDKIFAEQEKKLVELDKSVKGLEEKMGPSPAKLLSPIITKQNQIETRTLKILGRIDVIRQKGFPLSSDESTLMETIRGIRKSVSEGRFEEKANEAKKRINEDIDPHSFLSKLSPENNEALTSVLKTLSVQNESLRELLKCIKEDFRRVEEDMDSIKM
eukprot:GHVP01017512.1.p1 GENE.GHVP01017512.1~~GHVP01017512.1.p1  ORF type:complete len:216 (+),score=52.60 GHVP01017512.1:430-1077(+)